MIGECLGDFSLDNMENRGLFIIIYDFLVDYDGTDIV